eukprot:CAMPEP_0118666884 /NCGR_PEP_ID=MMETSP0785-20121206/19468_1 /TAXON_ID=91992 /ORGANISM="Bolidomonas pacifica, Strain CCMP 1866" /LENGTH=964 /DNA_ID=CAMNT_0006561255 /DNA_START=101 /DNA_END=2996 /DNA_ORIENTATION=+
MVNSFSLPVSTLLLFLLFPAASPIVVSTGEQLVNALASSTESDVITLVGSTIYEASGPTAEAAFAFPHPLHLTCKISSNNPCVLSGSQSWGVLNMFTGTSSQNIVSYMTIVMGNRVAGGGAYCQEMRMGIIDVVGIFTKATFVSVKFISNRCYTNSYGCGMYVRDGSTVHVELCIFKNNVAGGEWGRGGAMYIDDGSVVTITGTEFTSNIANSENSGGGIWLHSGYVEIFGTTFDGNQPNDLTRNGGKIHVSGCDAGYEGSSGDALDIFGGSITGDLFSFQCSACEKGRSSLAGANNCTACEAGKFSAHIASAFCLDCGVNKYNSLAGSSECFDCPPGRYSSHVTATSDELCAYYAPNSTAQVNPTVVAGEVMLVPLTLKGNMNMPLNGSVDFGPDWVTFRANTNITSSAFNRTFTNGISNSGDYFVGSDGIPKGRIKFDAAEVWSVSISNPLDGKHFSGSPFEVSVLPSSSLPENTAFDLPLTIVAGSIFKGSAWTFDSFLNPTFHPSDTLTMTLDSFGTKLADQNPVSRGYDIVSSTAIKVSGNYQINWELNEVSLPPYGFMVLPAAVSNYSTHNLVNIDGKTLDSTTETTIEVEIYPRDRFSNAVPDNSALFTLKKIVGGNEEIVPLDDSVNYRHEIPIPSGMIDTIVLEFYLSNKTDIQISDSPIRIKVEPKPVESLLPIYVGVGSTLLLMPLSVFLFKQAASRGIERGKEKRLRFGDKLKGMIGNRIRMQYFWLAVETIDVLSDFLNFLVAVGSGVSVGSSKFIVLLAVALMSCPVGFYGVMIRLRMINGLNKIVQGDHDTMVAYEKAMSHAEGGELTSENYLIRLDMISLDLTVIELSLRGMVLEDGPSAIINLWYVVTAGSADFDLSRLLQLFACLCSIFMIGRKSALTGKRKEIIEVKRDIEEALEKEGAEVEPGGRYEKEEGVEGIEGKLSAKVVGEELITKQMSGRETVYANFW